MPPAVVAQQRQLIRVSLLEGRCCRMGVCQPRGAHEAAALPEELPQRAAARQGCRVGWQAAWGGRLCHCVWVSVCVERCRAAGREGAQAQRWRGGLPPPALCRLACTHGKPVMQGRMRLTTPPTWHRAAAQQAQRGGWRGGVHRKKVVDHCAALGGGHHHLGRGTGSAAGVGFRRGGLGTLSDWQGPRVGQAVSPATHHLVHG